MKIKSTTYYWLAVIFGGVGMGTAMGAEGTAQTTGYISGTLFSVSLVLILAAVLLARLGFAAEDREKATKQHKYSFFQEVIKRDEVDSLPPIRRKKRRACPCANTDKPKG